MKRVILAAVTLALALALTFLLSGALAASPQNLSADSTITNLRMSDTSGGPARVNFPLGTQMVYASFDYANTGGTLTGILTVKDDLATGFQDSRSCTGSGTQTFTIRGTDIFTAYLNESYSNGLAITGYITRAQLCTNTVCVTPTVQLAINEANKMQPKLLRAQTFTNTPACLTAVVSATAAVNFAISEGQIITGLTNLPDMQTHLNLMQNHANNAVTYTQQAIDNVNGSIENAFPNTPPCGWRYTTSDSADTSGGPSLAASVDWIASVDWTVGTPGAPAQISLATRPSSIPPGSTSAVTATVKDNACILLDGTTVNFSASAGSILPGSTTTSLGIANATFTAPAHVGSAVIMATAGSAQMTTTISYGPDQVQLSAFPAVIVNKGAKSGLSVELRDVNGSKIGYPVLVTLTTTLGKFQEGDSINTEDGQGFATLVAESTGGIATITANAGTKSGATTVTIQFKVYMPVLLKRYIVGW
jgi:hypothetical protein